uniref:Uncharacterized protein n=1 Tax=Bionectria ochroleuca TaxID=29856 RepID=A0A8H7TVQ2_BIOOC
MAPNQRNLGTPLLAVAGLQVCMYIARAAHETRCDRRYASAEDLVSGAWTHVGETPALWRADSVGGKQPADQQTEAIAVMMEVAGHAPGRQLPSCSSLVASPLTASRSSGTWQNGTVLE